MNEHNLVPPFILEQYAAGRLAGELTAAALFVDVSGFTPLTAALMQHGKAGAEAVADALLVIFEPLIEIVAERGGFVAAFAGDAFLAIFPADQPGMGARALAAGRDIQVYMAARPEIVTSYGTYPFSVRLGLAHGKVAWGILGDETQRQHTGYFRGEAVERSAAMQRKAGPGELCLAPEIESLLAQTHATAIDAQAVSSADTAPLAPADGGRAGRAFFAPDLLTSPVRGEFRDVVSVFINLPEDSPHAGLAGFVRLIYRLLETYGGYLCRVGLGFAEQGCSLLLFWGAPACYENDLARALGFLLDLRAASELTFRAGVTQQMAYAGYVGSPRREEYTCHGSRVNLANRLMAAAAPGEIWVDPFVARRSSGHFALAPLKKHAFKGFDQPLLCYELRGRTAESRLYEGAMVGRQAELAQLAASVAPLWQGRFAGVVAVWGEAGMGKSRLLASFRQTTPNALWLVGPCDPLLRSALNPFRYGLRSYFEQDAGASEAENRAHFDAAVDGLLAALHGCSVPGLPDELERVRPFLGALIGLHWPGSLYEQVEPKLRLENTLNAVKVLIQAECRQQPVILALEDVHWIDADSHKLLEMLTRDLAAYPLALVCTGRYRDDGSRPPLQADTAAPRSTIELDGLPHDALAALAAQHLGGTASAALVSLLAEKATGNPFFTEQMLLDLRERDRLVRVDGQWSLAGSRLPADLPTDIRAVLLARLDRLARDVKTVVQTAAVLGREFAVQVLSQMLHDEKSLPEKVKQAQAEAIWSALNELRYIFRHALLRDAAYEMQLHARLRELHALAAEALQQVYAADLSPHFADLAYHCDKAENFAQAVDWYQRAARQAAEQFANEDARACCDRAFALAGKTAVSAQQRFDLLALRETILERMGARAEQWADLEAMEALAQDERQRCQVLQRKILRHRVLAERAAEKALIDDFKPLAHQLGDASWMAEACYTEGLYYSLVDKKSLSQASLNEALALYQQTGNIARALDCCCALAIIDLKRWQYAEAMAWIEKAQALNAAHPRPEQLAAVLRSAASASLIHKAPALGYQFANQLLEVAATIGARKRQASAHLLRGQTLCAMFRIEEGFEALGQALQIEEGLRNKHSVSIVLGEFAYQYMSLGDYDLAKAYFQRSMAIDRESDYPHGYCTSLLNLAFIALCQEDVIAAKALYRQGLAMARELENTYLQAIAIGSLGEAEQLAGEYETALQHTNQSIELLEALDQPAEVAIMQIDLAITHLKMGAFERAIHEAEKLVAAFPRANQDLNDAQRLLWGAARVFHTTGQAGRAQQLLAQAYALYMEKLQQIPDARTQTAFGRLKFNRQIVAAFERESWPE
ncbi:MAG: AAA family ATPase [Chloroflexota bacterium]